MPSPARTVEDKAEGEVAYALRRSGRARRLSVTVRPGGDVVVTAPWGIGDDVVADFLREKAAWLRRAIERMRRYRGDVFLPRDRRSYLRHREAARAMVRALVARHAAAYGVPVRKIFIKDLRRNWGSCSERGNLNFNYKIALLPPRLAEYVVVHEVCHLLRFDHSPAFWALVARTMPDHRELRRALRRYHA